MHGSQSIITTGAILSLLAVPSYAHTIVVSGDIAGTWHIEPNHSPSAGAPAQIWIALTRQGGEPVTLEQCDCTLQVYALPNDTQPALTPTLAATDLDGQPQIPSTTLTFPQAGAYRLVLQGKPKSEGDFQPFELDYTTVVSRGAIATKPAPQAKPNTTKSKSDEPGHANASHPGDSSPKPEAASRPQPSIVGRAIR